jgi:hypothetical protein
VLLYFRFRKTMPDSACSETAVENLDPIENIMQSEKGQVEPLVKGQNLPHNACGEDVLEDIEDILRGEGGQVEPVPRERFNNRTEVTLRTKKRNKVNPAEATDGKINSAEKSEVSLNNAFW